MSILHRTLYLLLPFLLVSTVSAQVASPRVYPLSSIADRIDAAKVGNPQGEQIEITLVHADGADLSGYEVAIVSGGLLYRGPFASPVNVSRNRVGYYQRPLQVYLIDSRSGQVHSWRNDTLYALGLENSVQIKLNPRRIDGQEFVLSSLERPESSSLLDVNTLAPIGGAFGDPHESTNAFTMGDPHEGTNTFNRRGADGGAVNPGTTESEANQWYEQQLRTADSLQDVLSGNEGDISARLALGAANDSLGFHYDAIKAYHHAVEQEPRNPRALVGLARAYDNYVRDSVAGQKSLRQMITDEPAIGYAEQDEKTTALDPLLDALKIDPANAEAHALAGRIYRRLGNTREGVNHAKKGADLAPGNAQYLAGLAAAYNDAGDKAKAIDAATKALKIDPNDSRTRRLLALLLSGTGKHRDAITAATQLLQRDSTDADAWLLVGRGHAGLGKQREAIEALNAAVRHARNPGEAYEALGASYQALNKPDDARVAYQLAAEFRPDLADSHFRSGVAALGSGDRKRAAKEVEILKLMDSSRAAELEGKMSGR